MKTSFLHASIDIRLVSYRLEIGFWRLAIDLLTDSKVLQRLIRGASQLHWKVVDAMQTLELNKVALWAATWLVIGFFVAILGAYLCR